MKKTYCLIGFSFLANFILFAQDLQDIRIKYNNPNIIVDLGVGLWGSPIPVDYNNDGLMDIIMSCPDTPYKGIYYYKNIGTKNQPLFDVSIKLSDKAFQNTKASYINNSLKIIRQGIEYTNFTETLFDKQEKIKVDALPESDIKKIRSDIWSYVDFDCDENQDIIVGIDDWGDYGWDSAYDLNGKWTNGPLRGYVYWLENEDGIYRNKGKIKAGNKILETYGAPFANMADFNGDGKSEIICGEFLDKLTWYQNTGSKKSPKFDSGKLLLNENGNIIKLYVEMITPIAVDFNQDGHVDLLVGDEDGRVAFIKNTGKIIEGMPIFKTPVYLKQKADNLKFGALSTPFSVDWDNDGDEDIICGNSAGNISFIENINGNNSPSWAEPIILRTNGTDIRIMAGKNGSIQGPAEEKWGYTTISVADWDNDGNKDIIVNTIFGKIIWYKNVSDKINLVGPFNVKVYWDNASTPKPLWNWWSPEPTDLVTQWRTTPFAIDWNKDGLTDLVMLDHEGYLSLYKRFEKNGELWLKPGKRIFYTEDMSTYDHSNKPIGLKPQPLQLNREVGGKSGRRKLCLVDWNKDGRIDLMVNSRNVCYFENVRESGDTIFFINKGDVSNIRLAGHETSPTPVDWDKDCIYDLLTGAEDGHFYLIKNLTQTIKE